jgi:acyl-CoA reductase-like NAD-dependent aldehyde dehydrogenase
MTTPTLPPGGLLIGDRLLEDASGGTIEHVNPATGKPQATLALAGGAEVDQAVTAAREGARAWRALPAAARREALDRLTALVKEHGEEFAAIGALESGMPVFTGGGLELATEWMRYYTGWADKAEGQVVSIPAGGLDYVLPEPYGVVAVIIPWNSPLVAISMTVFPALAAGNAVVLKPPELAPFAAVRFGRLALEAGLPPGALTVIPGGPEAGDALVRHPGVDKVSFTGGGATAQKVMRAASATTKPLMLELGGKSANIIFPDADLDAAVPMAAQLALVVNAGQGCCLPTRLLVHDDVYDEATGRLIAVTEHFRLGDPLEPTTVIGPVISGAACRRILGVAERAVTEKQGTLLIGGGRAGGPLADGFFVEPTIFGDVDHASSLAQEEIFGPVLAVSRFSTEEQAIEMANGTSYGLMAYLQTGDLARAHRVASRLEAGNVSVNGFYGMAPGAPFGGVKASGFGRTGGRAGLEEFLRPKNVFVHVPPAAS